MRSDIRYLGWHGFADINKYKYGLVPISGYKGRFLAVEERMTLRSELSVIRRLREGSTSERSNSEFLGGWRERHSDERG